MRFERKRPQNVQRRMGDCWDRSDWTTDKRANCGIFTGRRKKEKKEGRTKDSTKLLLALQKERRRGRGGGEKKTMYYIVCIEDGNFGNSITGKITTSPVNRNSRVILTRLGRPLSHPPIKNRESNRPLTLAAPQGKVCALVKWRISGTRV